MVSLRRKKLMEMAEGAKRRSARLLALEELRSEKAVLALPVGLQQKRMDGRTHLQKRGRKSIKEIDVDAQGSQDASNINGNWLNSPSASRRATDRIIGYILDMLEVKDTDELFSMPDNLQTYDYEESMKQPGDFATLRQKHTDKIYTTLEQFERDVLMVFHKAINSNAPDSIPFLEAITQRDHAKQIFQSLKNNLAYAELELSEWHQSYFKYKRRSLRNDSKIGASSSQPEHSSRLANSMGMKHHAGTSNSASVRRRPQSMSSSRPRRRAVLIEHEHPQLPEEQRRYTYNARNESNESLLTMCIAEPKSCIYNNTTLSYQESLRRFVNDAGPIAKLVAENKCLEYSKRLQVLSIWRPSPFGSQSKIGCQTSYFPSTQSQHSGASKTLVSKNFRPSSSSTNTTDHSSSNSISQRPSDKFEDQACQLQTDELLTLFSLIGTPEFLQRSLASGSNQHLNSKLGFSSFLQGSCATQVGLRSTNQIGQSSKFKPEVPNARTSNELLIWQPRLNGSKPGKEKEPAGYELNPCSENMASSSASAGFHQNHNCSFSLNPPSLNMFRGLK